MKIGAHILIGGGLEKALETSELLGCDCFQIFLQNPRSWKRRRRPASEMSSFRKGIMERGISPLAIHMPYLLNLSSSDPVTRSMSMKLLEFEMEEAEAAGADYYVIHPGSHKGAGLGSGIKTLAENLKNFVGRKPLILIENTAGQGNSVGGDWSNFTSLLEKFGTGLGLCLDTAHAFEAGYDIREESGLAEMVDVIEKSAGLSYILMLHANDSATRGGSKSDRHANIGEGLLGKMAFENLVKHGYFGNLPFIIETPKSTVKDDMKNLAILREIGKRYGKI